MFSFIQLQADTLANAASNVVVEKIATTNNEISVLGFLLKGGFFLIPIGILLFYTFYLIIERYLYINRKARVDPLLMRDVKDHLTSGNFELARSITERTNTASGNVIKEGIALIGRPIAEIESNMDRAADIE